MKHHEKIVVPAKNTAKERKSAKKILLSAGSIIILILAAASFIFLPAMVQSFGQELPPFGYYDRIPIKYESGSYFAQAVEYYSQMTKASGRSLDQDTFQIFYYAYNEAALNTAYIAQVEKSGYIIPQAEINRQMLQRPEFHDNTGKYSAKVFNSTPQADKILIRDQAVQGLTVQRYTSDMLGAQPAGAAPVYGTKVFSGEIPFIEKMAAQERSFRMAFFPTDNYPPEETAAFGKAHPELFTKYDLSVVTCETEEQAEKVLQQLNSNEIVFADAVSGFSLKNYSGDDGKLTSSYQYQLKNILTSESDMSLLGALEKDALSGVIKTSSGYSIFRCDSVPVPADMEAPDMQNTVLNYMKTYEAGTIESYFISRAADFAAAASQNGFDSAAMQFEAQTADIPAFPLNYGSSPMYSGIPTASVAELSGADTNENFLQTAFSLHKNEISEPLVLGKNIVVLQMQSETVADENTLQLIGSSYETAKMQADDAAMRTAILTGSRFEDNFFDVFYEYILPTN